MPHRNDRQVLVKPQHLKDPQQGRRVGTIIGYAEPYGPGLDAGAVMDSSAGMQMAMPNAAREQDDEGHLRWTGPAAGEGMSDPLHRADEARVFAAAVPHPQAPYRQRQAVVSPTAGVANICNHR